MAAQSQKLVRLKISDMKNSPMTLLFSFRPPDFLCNGLQFFYFVGILFQNWIPLKGFVWCEYCKHICQDWELSILETKLIQTRNIQRKSFAGPLDPKKNRKIFEQVSIQRVALLKFPFSMQIAKKGILVVVQWVSLR